MGYAFNLCKFHIYNVPYNHNMMMPGPKGQKAVHACMIRLLKLGPAKHEKVAIYAVNQRISNVYRIAPLQGSSRNSTS